MNTRCMKIRESMYIFKNYIRMMITIMKIMCVMMILVIGISHFQYVV